MVVDGTGDHGGDFERAQYALAADNVVRWQRFTSWCVENTSCALYGQNVAKLWQGIVAKANREPLRVTADATFDGSTVQEVGAGRLLRAGGPADWAAFAQTSIG